MGLGDTGGGTEDGGVRGQGGLWGRALGFGGNGAGSRTGAGGPPCVPSPGPLRAGQGSHGPSEVPGGWCTLTLAPMADGGAEPQDEDEHSGGQDPEDPQSPASSPGHGRYQAGARSRVTLCVPKLGRGL